MSLPAFVILTVGLWLAILIVWVLVSKAVRSADASRIKNRLAGVSQAKPAKATRSQPLIRSDDLRTGKLVLQLLRKLQLVERLGRLLEQAGLKWHVARLIHACLALFLVGFALVWLVPLMRKFAVLGGIALGVLPVLYVLRERAIRLRRFEAQFPESLEFVARSMRAGHAFSVSLEMLHREFQEPLAGEFRRTFEEHNLGLPLELALQKLAQRVPSLDVHFFVSAVLLQKRTGGNLAEILDKLAYIIRERFKLRGRIRAVSAHGRMTGAALTCIPIAVGALLFYVNPSYASFFFEDATGRWMLGAAVALQVVGYGVIKKIVSIEV